MPLPADRTDDADPPSPLRLCVYCGTSRGASPAYLAAATDLGRAIADAGWSMVYGGGRLGLMGAVADAVLGAGGEVVGIIPQSLARAEVAHAELTSLEVADSMHTRKARMAELADAFVALPGGFGTFEELLEVLTWNQLGFLRKPVVVFDVDGYYSPLFEMFSRSAEAGFVRDEHAALAQRATTVAEVLRAVRAGAPATPHKWIDLDRDGSPDAQLGVRP
jgi:uncharacterized protein (TIGR00730 family)